MSKHQKGPAAKLASVAFPMFEQNTIEDQLDFVRGQLARAAGYVGALAAIQDGMSGDDRFEPAEVWAMLTLASAGFEKLQGVERLLARMSSRAGNRGVA